MKQWIFITGPVYSGKTTKLIKNYAQYGGAIYSHPRDNTYKTSVETHNKEKINCIFSKKPDPKENIVHVDEIQFYNFQDLENLRDKKVFYYGLTYDFRGNYFPISALLLEYCKVEKIYGECSVCSNPSVHSKLISGNPEGSILVGDYFVPVCEECFKK